MYDLNAQKTNSNKKREPMDNYSGSSHKNQYNNNSNKNNVDDKFNKTKNKIKVILYQNGFILNNGPFRDKAVPENREFMNQLEQGLIPQEFIKKGIVDLGILLENRKHQVYKAKAKNPITNTLNDYIYGGANVKISPEIKIHPPIYLKPGEEIDISKFQFNDPFINNNEYDNDYQYPKDLITKERNKIDILNNCHTPIEARRTARRNIFIEKNEKKENENEEEGGYGLQKKASLSAPKKKEDKKFHTFSSFLKKEQERQEEEKQQKRLGIKKEEETIEEDKKFTAFTGEGKLIGNVNMEGLQVNKNVKNIVNKSFPTCTISIRLFNGEVVKSEFNLNQTLRHIYFYVQKISGSNNFYLLEGFPPKPLREYNRTIQELKLENTILTQKLN
jgi:hypothetical protein